MIKTIYSENRIFMLLFVVWAVLLTFLLLAFGNDQVFLWVNGHYNSFLNVFFEYITYLGDGVTYVILAGLVFWRKGWRLGLVVLLTYAITGLSAQVLKRFIFSHCDRPLQHFSDIGINIHTVPGVTTHLHNSFPSGHTVSAFSMAMLLCLLHPRSKHQWFILLAILVAYSRMYLGQHFPVDVLAGSIWGTVMTLIFWYAVPQNFKTSNQLQKIA